MDIGLFGGTFNPFHLGHLGIIQHVQSVRNLEKILFIPSATPPHKPDTNLAPAQYRFQMVEQSLEHHTGLSASDKELQRKGPSFTIDTINEFKKEYGPDTRFHLLMGSDAFLDITTWERKDEIFEAITIMILLRGDWKNFHPIISFIEKNISKAYTFNQKDNTFFHDTKHPISICQVPRIDISSSMIRKRIKEDRSIKELVPEPVEELIRTKELYQ